MYWCTVVLVIRYIAKPASVINKTCNTVQVSLKVYKYILWWSFSKCCCWKYLKKITDYFFFFTWGIHLWVLSQWALWKFYIRLPSKIYQLKPRKSCKKNTMWCSSRSFYRGLWDRLVHSTIVLCCNFQHVQIRYLNSECAMPSLEDCTGIIPNLI